MTFTLLFLCVKEDVCAFSPVNLSLIIVVRGRSQPSI